jgi:hypothetical protein
MRPVGYCRMASSMTLNALSASFATPITEGPSSKSNWISNLLKGAILHGWLRSGPGGLRSEPCSAAIKPPSNTCCHDLRRMSKVFAVWGGPPDAVGMRFPTYFLRGPQREIDWKAPYLTGEFTGTRGGSLPQPREMLVCTDHRRAVRVLTAWAADGKGAKIRRFSAPDWPRGRRPHVRVGR